MTAPVYLRDLKDSEQTSYIEQWKEQGRTELLRALKEGLDIIVGEYRNTGSEEVEI